MIGSTVTGRGAPGKCRLHAITASAVPVWRTTRKSPVKCFNSPSSLKKKNVLKTKDEGDKYYKWVVC